ncbi:MAG: DNA polymerase IV [Planctomycetota bacterium]|nr:MAG: DNA polymerase IV [Planctomycetota bacterium]
MSSVDTPRTILHADMDAFYAAVEQRDDPKLRGRPVIVGGLGRRGVVSTASYEARAFGVHSALPTERARALCPQGVFLRPRMSAYVEVSGQVRAVFDGFTDQVEPLSLDEAFLDVSGCRRLFGDGPAIAAAIRRGVAEATGLTVSVGVACNKFVAKVASDQNKPDGLTVVPAGAEAAFLAPLPTARLWGAGAVTQAKLAALGCLSIGDVQTLDPRRLASALGEGPGAQLVSLALGLDTRPLVCSSEPRSIGRESTFETDLVDQSACLDVLLALAEDVGRRLRYRGLAARTIRLKLRHPPFVTLTRQRQPPRPTSADEVIYSAARELFLAARPGRRPVRLLGVTAAELRPAEQPRQSQLFEDRSATDSSRVDGALDAIRERFGPGSAGRMGQTRRER